MLEISRIKNRIKSVFLSKVSSIEGIISISFVGSFETSIDISLISDIDIILIVDQLSESKFLEIREAANSITGTEIGLNDYSIKLNMTFGPLKLNDEKTAVFHLMIYDINGHRKHVIESPFTCLDWECFPAVFGKNLSEIYPSFGVQIDDIFSSRRSLSSYLEDYKNQSITYREYDFTIKPYGEKKVKYNLDERHRIEYVYHIIKFLQINLIKILFQENKRYSIDELKSKFSTLHKSFATHADFLGELHDWKYNKSSVPESLFERLNQFVLDLNNWLENLDLRGVSFIRHAKTPLNDGSFLGIRRDPSIINSNNAQENEFDVVYTGTLKRTIETGLLFNSKFNFQDPLLNEIDYGDAEGLKIEELNQLYPEIVEAWKRNEDPNFPHGESQSDVLQRLNQFLLKGFEGESPAVVTHNIVLRALIGDAYKQPIHRWFRLNPGHLEAINFSIYENKLLPFFNKEQRIRFKDEFVGISESISKYGIFWIPENNLVEFVESLKDEVRKEEQGAIYLNHPVHSTVFLFNSFEANERLIIESIDEKAIELFIDGINVFWNDEVTNRHTIYLGIKANEEIINIQKHISDTLLGYVTGPLYYPNNWKGEYKESFDKYGFPFVGSHWIPHLTIASVKNENKRVVDKILSNEFGKSSAKGHLALFKIIGESHDCIHIWK